MFGVLLFSCELKLKLKDQSNAPQTHDLLLHKYYSKESRKQQFMSLSTRSVKMLYKALEVFSFNGL